MDDFGAGDGVGDGVEVIPWLTVLQPVKANKEPIIKKMKKYKFSLNIAILLILIFSQL